MHKRTCKECFKIFETNYYYSFFCEDCCAKRINIKIKKEKQKPVGVASYSGWVGYLKYTLKQPNWVKLLNTTKEREFTHSKF